MALITEREIRLLDFHKITDMLSGLTLTAMGNEKALSLLPSSDLNVVKQSLRETTEACKLLEMNYVNISSIPDIRPILGKVAKNGIITPSEAFDVRQFINAAAKLLKSVQSEKVKDISFIIKDQVDCIYGNPGLLRLLDKSLTSDKEISDDATPHLKEVTQKIKRLSNTVYEKLNGYLKSPAYRKYLQEPLITIRNDRYVIPVKQEYRSNIAGIFHDQSSSGATLFIEPFAVADMQNRLQREKNERDKEIDRILAVISSAISQNSASLWNDLNIYGAVDFILAKGRLSFSLKGTAPHVLPKPEINFIKARHPLLKGNVVPVDVELGVAYNTMVITGPNTGGKTVTLKTVGLLAILAQSGLHIPVANGSMTGIFKKIRCDIGDEQSIEQSLSTFSSHLNNIISIIKEADDSTMILLDELGAGTDPSEGAALARAILSELNRKGALVIATTHINDLKIFAQVTPGVENASLAFDAQTLSPTYNLITGVPGSSNAMNIAGKLGLEPYIIDMAKSFLSERHQEIEEVIGSLNDKRKKLSEDSLKAAIELRKAEELRVALEKERALLAEKKEKVMAKAKYDAKNIIKLAKAKADESIGEIDRIITSADDRKKALQEAEKVRRSVRAFTREISGEPASSHYDINGERDERGERGDDRESVQMISSAIINENLKVGDYVTIHSLKKEGIIKKISVGRKTVQVDIEDITVNTKLEDIYIPAKEAMQKMMKKNDNKKIKRSFTTSRNMPDMSNEIMLRGLTMDEAAARLDKFLDNAVFYGLDKVFIIHGRGTGRLRRGVAEILRNYKNIKEFRIGYPEEGGIGVTVAYF